jgi:hypothetical protein
MHEKPLRTKKKALPLERYRRIQTCYLFSCPCPMQTETNHIKNVYSRRCLNVNADASLECSQTRKKENEHGEPNTTSSFRLKFAGLWILHEFQALALKYFLLCALVLGSNMNYKQSTYKKYFYKRQTKGVLRWRGSCQLLHSLRSITIWYI